MDGDTCVAMAIDTDGLHRLTLGAAGRLVLAHERGDRRSTLHQALRRCLRVKIGDTWRTFEEGDWLDVAPRTTVECFLEGAECGLVALGSLDPVGGEVHEKYRLSAFETRFLAEYGQPHPPAVADGMAGLTTDLHTHFAGCVGARHLVELAVALDLDYPTALLREVGVSWPVGDETVALRTLATPIQDELARRMAVPTERRITFLGMEQLYRLRAPITKHPRAFLPLCARIAGDYAAQGVTYAELSLSEVVHAARLRPLMEALPRIEAATGVRLRFLVGMSRHSDYEWDLDTIARLRQLGPCPAIVGVDFMGHETNSTRAFERQIGLIARWAHEHRPGFVIRVHAGENPAHPENVQVALDAVEGCGVQLRVGHGLYGVDDATVARLAATRTIVEFNLNSNFALTNIQHSREVPLRRYVHAGVPVVLGTDGYGIYRTTAAGEVRAARLVGLTEADLDRIRSAERAYLARREAADAGAPWAGYRVPDDPARVHFTPRVEARKRAAQEALARAWDDRLRGLGLPCLDEEALRARLRGKEVVSFAGPWLKSWPLVSPAWRERIVALLEEVFAELDRERVVVLSGGTCHGLEGVVAALTRARGISHIGTLVRDLPPETLEGGVDAVHFIARSFYDKAAALYGLMAEHGGLCVFIGGGNVVNDEIQIACNLRVRHLLMLGPEGASTEHARQHPERVFSTAAQLLDALNTRPWESSAEAYWHLGANPTVDAVVVRSCPATGRPQVLLIRRDMDAPVEPGRWALPGGFVHTTAPRGEPWLAGAETPREACVRELAEEAGLDLRPWASALIEVGTYEGGGRDPRDTPRAWSRSTCFAMRLTGAPSRTPILGGDDACDAAWFDLDDVPVNLAFDHDRILHDALCRLDGVEFAPNPGGPNSADHPGPRPDPARPTQEPP